MGKSKPKELQDAFDGHLLPSRRRELELEFIQWAKDTGARADAFNLIGWLQDKGLMLSDRKRKLLTDVRDVLVKAGWMTNAAMIDEVLKD